MAAIDAKLVMELRRLTDLPVMECKAALLAAGGDLDAAGRSLRWVHIQTGHGCVHASPEFRERLQAAGRGADS